MDNEVNEAEVKLADFILDLYCNKHLNQTEMGEIMGMTQQNVSYILNKLKKIEKYAEQIQKENEYRKEQSKEKRKITKKEYQDKKRKEEKEEKKRLYARMMLLQIQNSVEMSKVKCNYTDAYPPDGIVVSVKRFNVASQLNSNKSNNDESRCFLNEEKKKEENKMW